MIEGLVCGSRVMTSPALRALKGFDADERLSPDDASACVQQIARHGEGNDLDRRHHLARFDDLEGRDRGKRQAFMQPVEAANAVGVDDDQTPALAA